MTVTITGDQTGTVGLINAKTAQNSTSGTSIDFTGIPAGVKRITVMFQGTSLSSTANYQIQIGSGSFTTTGYVCVCNNGAGTNTTGNTTGFLVTVSAAASDMTYGFVTLVNQSGNVWLEQGLLNNGGAPRISAGTVTLSGTLDRVRITSTSTDTFDAGSINILYE